MTSLATIDSILKELNNPAKKVRILMIDAQQDFCNDGVSARPKGSLYVPNANLDIEIMISMLEMLKKDKDRIEKFMATFDNHSEFHIAHELLVDTDTKEPAKKFTIFKIDDTDNSIKGYADGKPDGNTYIVNVAGFYKYKNLPLPKDIELEQKLLNAYARTYIQLLGEHKKPAIKWPNHCIQGTSGQQLHEDLQRTITELGIRIFRFNKGMNNLTEKYSAVKPEVPVSDVIRELAKEFEGLGLESIVDTLAKYQDGAESDGITDQNLITTALDSPEPINILLFGEASSHCVSGTGYDLIKELDKYPNARLIYVSNAASPVTGSEVDGQKFLNVMNINDGKTFAVNFDSKSGIFTEAVVAAPAGGRRRNPFKSLLRKVTKRRKHMKHSTNKKRVKKQIRTRKGKKAQKTRSRK